MSKVTVNILVEISDGGKSNKYTASNGVTVNGVVTEKDVMNLVNFGAKQIMAEAHQETTHNLSELQAQDAVVFDE